MFSWLKSLFGNKAKDYKDSYDFIDLLCDATVDSAISERRFFGKAHPWFGWTLTTLELLNLIGYIAACYYGIGNAEAFAWSSLLIVIVVTAIAAILRLLYLWIEKIVKNKSKSK